MSARVGTVVVVTLLLAPIASSGCTFVQILEAPQGADAATSADASADAPPDEGADSALPVCVEGASGTAQSTSLGSVLVLAWERLDGRFFVVRGRAELDAERRSFRVSTAAPEPPPEARISSEIAFAAIGHVYAAAPEATLEGLVDGATLRAAATAGTYRDALVYVAQDRPTGARIPSWLARAPSGYSVWTCSAAVSKEEAYRESRCDAMELESAPDPLGDRACDWH